MGVGARGQENASLATKKEGRPPDLRRPHTFSDDHFIFLNRGIPKIKWPKSGKFSEFGGKLTMLPTDSSPTKKCVDAPT